MAHIEAEERSENGVLTFVMVRVCSPQRARRVREIALVVFSGENFALSGA